jgi:non-reducing end alpha-L-arabinofuranosidase
MRYSGAVRSFSVLLAAIISICIAQGRLSAAPCPCDIYAAGGTPCVAAHSSVRALYSTYNGPLYQVKRTSDKATRDIGLLTQGGYVNAAVQDSFLAGKPGTISIIYDQSPQGNHLKASPVGGWLYVVANESNAADTMIQIFGHKAYGIYTKRGGGYRNNQATGIATGSKSESMYMVASGKSVNDSCCYDYGNVETNMKDNGTGTMETIYLGKLCWFGPCTGSGPWIFADLENGLFTGANGKNANNTSVAYDYVTAMIKGDATTYTIRAGNGTTGTLKTMGTTNRPAPNHLEGAIVLGLGGDNSWAARGIFFEGAMTAGKAPDTTEDAIQKNIIAAGYGIREVSTVFSANEASPGSPLRVCYNPSRTSAVISYTMRDARHVSMNIFNQQGRRIAAIVDGVVGAGSHEAVWDAKRVPAGVYVCRAAIDGMAGWTGKIIVGK